VFALAVSPCGAWPAAFLAGVAATALAVVVPRAGASRSPEIVGQ